MKWLLLLSALLLSFNGYVSADPWADDDYQYASFGGFCRVFPLNADKVKKSSPYRQCSFPEPAAALFMITGITGILLFSRNIRRK